MEGLFFAYIITYLDKRYFNGDIYRNNKFIELNSSGPGYHYTNYRYRYNRQKFMKQLSFYNSKLTECENMQINGWDRIYDCGNYVFKI